MIKFEEFTLKNGLKVIIHEDHNVEIAVVNLLYNVGSRDESPEKTGFAHLFEHLMFGGSKNVNEFDSELQRVGGENNAFTSPDITNYYITVPAQNIETALWLESDRMLSLSFDPNVLEVQRSVVIEEFKQRYLNQPYGDLWLQLRPLAYQKHPYQWATIGKDISHIENATMDDVKAFFYKFYIPNNATLVIGGKINTVDVKKQVEKWFGSIPSGTPYLRKLPKEPVQNEPRFMRIENNVPQDALYKVYHMPERANPRYYAIDMLSEILGYGKSSRLYKGLVKNKQLFSTVSANVTGSVDAGLFIIGGRLKQGVDIREAEEALLEEIENIKLGIEDDELIKVQNQAEGAIEFGRVDLLERCMALAYADVLGDVNLINTEKEHISAVTKSQIVQEANQILQTTNCSTLHYCSVTK